MAIPWIPLITAGASLLGGLFGKSESQSTSTNQASNGTQTGIGTTNASVEGKTNTAVTQNQTSSQTSNQTGTEQQVQQQTGAVTRLDAGTLDLLTSKVREALNGNNAQSVVQNQLNTVGGATPIFDRDAYINGIMSQSTSRINSDLESGGNQIDSRAGARGTTNSASALLRAKLNQQGNAELAGIRSNAEATAAEIQRANTESKTNQITSLATSAEQSVANMLQSLLSAGEQTTQAGTSSGTSTTGGTTTGTTTGNTNTAETSEQLQVQNSLTTAIANEIAKSSGKGSSNSQDWSSLFDNIGKMFNPTF